ncbi:MAG: two pore domain potassium channel family protein, partial [Ignavibacteriales bacterium]|nr:two pore domain potassium channel family protein [Ignavibacteriales bacterium]
MNLKKPIYHQLKQIKIGLIIFLCVVVVGTFGYNFLEGWNFLESFYMTIITISTTGFKEVHELSDAGRLFTLFILVSGVGSIAFIGGRTIQMVFETRILR